MQGVLTCIGNILMVLLCILAVLVLILVAVSFSKLKFIMSYSDSPVFKLKMWFLNFNITKFMQKPKKRKKIKLMHFTGDNFGEMPKSKEKCRKKSKKEKNTVKKLKEAHPKEQKKSVGDFLSLVKDILSEISEPFGKCAFLEIKRMRITVASDDPYNTAILFGHINTAAGLVVLAGEKFKNFSVKDGEIAVYSDFSAKKIAADIEVVLTIKIKYVIVCLFKAIKIYLSNK